jgi:hypothetical protein
MLSCQGRRTEDLDVFFSIKRRAQYSQRSQSN